MRRVASQTGFWLTAALGAGAAALFLHYYQDRAFQSWIESRYGWQDEAFPAQFVKLAGMQAVLLLASYALSLDAHARRRPWAGMSAAAAGTGLTAALAGYLFAYQEFSALAWMAGAGGAVAVTALLLGFEFLNRWLWQAV
ncbi:hypothetical protein HZA57_03060, partial [Candidatus Poribacteria bacterium]|nr:hypothetical protein [Candidatus Poribacteria bacterium]